MTAIARTGHQTDYRKSTKADRKELAARVPDNGQHYSAKDDIAKHPAIPADPKSDRAAKDMAKQARPFIATLFAGDCHRGAWYVQPALLAPKKPVPAVLPQALQSNEDVVDAAAEARAIIPRAFIDSLMHNIEYGVAHPNAQEHHALDSGYYLTFKLNEVFLHDKDDVRQLKVASRKSLKDKMELCKKAEVRDFLIDVKNAVKRPNGNGHTAMAAAIAAAVLENMKATAA